MAHFFVVFFVCIAAAHAGILPGAVIQSGLLTKQVEQVDLRPQYTFSYAVNDPSTGDIKNQIESRDGDVVKGSYSLLDADGLTRVVQYSSDAVNGFNAIVSRTPLTKQVLAAPAPALIKSVPTILSAPSIIRPVAPIIQSQTILGSIPSLVQQPRVILGSPYGNAYSSSSLIRSPPSLGLALSSGLKSTLY